MQTASLAYPRMSSSSLNICSITEAKQGNWKILTELLIHMLGFTNPTMRVQAGTKITPLMLHSVQRGSRS